MGLVIQDGFPGVGAVTNLAGVDADSHLAVGNRAPAFRTLGAYSVLSTTGNIAATLGANSTLFAFQLSAPNAGNSPQQWPFPLIAIVQSVKVSAFVTGTITTAVPFDLSLIVGRSGNTLYNITGNGGTNATPALAEPPEAMRTSMSAWRCAPLYAATGALGGTSSGADTNPIARVQGNSGTAVGTQFFAGRNPQPLYLRDNVDHHPLILQGGTSTLNADTLILQNPFAGPATGTFSVEVQISWIEAVAY